MTAGRCVLALAAAPVLAGCGAAGREDVEQAVRDRARAAAPIERVSCTEGEVMWGCRLRLRDGRDQACQVAVRDGQISGVACQPLRGE